MINPTINPTSFPITRTLSKATHYKTKSRDWMIYVGYNSCYTKSQEATVTKQKVLNLDQCAFLDCLMHTTFPLYAI